MVLANGPQTVIKRDGLNTMNANVDETRRGSKTLATRKNYYPRYRVRKTNIRRRKRESARSPLG